VRAGRLSAPIVEVILDACCGEGGGARGYAQAGHYVVGVDTNPACRDGYLRSGAAEFICGDALEALADPGFMARFTAVAFHPPCQFASAMSACRPGLAATYPNLITPGRPLLEACGLPWWIENVARARRWLRDPVTLCMFMFGRPGYRHRLVEAGGGLTLTAPARPPGLPGRPHWECGWPHPVRVARAGHWEPGLFVSVAGHERKAPVRELMEIELWDPRAGTGWMSSRDAVKEAIPPYLGRFLIDQLTAWRAGRAAAA
jgi:DNA (cytosine-5)-methyltransferase 1